jgi:hypothetical protein
LESLSRKFGFGGQGLEQLSECGVVSPAWASLCTARFVLHPSPSHWWRISLYFNPVHTGLVDHLVVTYLESG